MINLITMRPFHSQEEMEVLRIQAKADNHHLVFPSHVVLKGNNPIGYVGIAPSIWGWFDRNKRNNKEYGTRDLLSTMNLIENVLIKGGHRGYCLPCTDESELLPYIKDVGYVSAGKLNLFLKGL